MKNVFPFKMSIHMFIRFTCCCNVIKKHIADMHIKNGTTHPDNQVCACLRPLLHKQLRVLVLM